MIPDIYEKMALLTKLPPPCPDVFREIAPPERDMAVSEHTITKAALHVQLDFLTECKNGLVPPLPGVCLHFGKGSNEDEKRAA